MSCVPATQVRRALVPAHVEYELRSAAEVLETSSLRRSLADNSSRCSGLQTSFLGVRSNSRAFRSSSEWPAMQAHDELPEFLMKMEAPPGFEPGMEVLQTVQGRTS